METTKESLKSAMNSIAENMILKAEELIKCTENSEPYKEEHNVSNQLIFVRNKDYSVLAAKEQLLIQEKLENVIAKMDPDTKEDVFEIIAQIEKKSMEEVLESKAIDDPAIKKVYACQLLIGIKDYVEKKMSVHQKDDNGVTM